MADGDQELETILMRVAELAIPVIVLGEYRFGVANSRLRFRYEKWLTETVADCRILCVDEKTAVEYARIRGELRQAGRPIPSNDVWIAALARQHSMPVLSKDAHFDLVPQVKRIEW
jgi:tRNA(fMet)-specific endonuclease VapC